MRPTADFPGSFAGTQITQAAVNPRPPCPIARFPAPEHFESSAVPPQDRIRLNHLDRTKQARPELGHPCEQDTITAAKPRNDPPCIAGCGREAVDREYETGQGADALD